MILSKPLSILATSALCLLAFPVFAQEAAQTAEPANTTTNPLLEMLALVPDTPETQAGTPTVSYIDYQALETAWEAIPHFASWQEWTAARESDDDLGARLWSTNTGRITAGPPLYDALADETQALIGFDLFAVDRAVAFGTPPANGTILAGDFDSTAIEAAFTARDYETSQVEGVTVLNGGTGMEMNAADINKANPFGGRLGRREPVAIAPGYVLNSMSDDNLETIIGTYTGSQTNILAQPSYAAAANAITQGEGLLIQALFFNPLHVGVLPGVAGTAMMGPNVDATQIAEAVEKGPVETREYGFMPVYLLAVMADRQEGDEQVILVALVYNDEETAEIAAAELTKRLSLFANSRMLRRDTPIINDIEGASMSEPRVYADEATGNYVAIAEARYPMPEPILYDMNGEPADENDAFAMPHSPGILFRRWVGAIWQVSFYPLVFMK